MLDFGCPNCHPTQNSRCTTDYVTPTVKKDYITLHYMTSDVRRVHTLPDSEVFDDH